MQRWDQVPRRSEHLLLTGHIRREPHFKFDISSQNQCPQLMNGTEHSVVKIGESSQVNGKIRSQNRCPDQVHAIIYSESQAYTDPWKNQR